VPGRKIFISIILSFSRWDICLIQYIVIKAIAESCDIYSHTVLIPWLFFVLQVKSPWLARQAFNQRPGHRRHWLFETVFRDKNVNPVRASFNYEKARHSCLKSRLGDCILGQYNLSSSSSLDQFCRSDQRHRHWQQGQDLICDFIMARLLDLIPPDRSKEPARKNTVYKLF
jgi:hypothetical protein